MPYHGVVVVHYRIDLQAIAGYRGGAGTMSGQGGLLQEAVAGLGGGARGPWQFEGGLLQEQLHPNCTQVSHRNSLSAAS